MINLRDKYNQAYGIMPNGHGMGKVVYSESHRNTVLEDYINDNLELLQGLFMESGLEFTFLPERLDYEDEIYEIDSSRHIVNEKEIKLSLFDETGESCQLERSKNNVRFRVADSLDKKYEQLRNQIPDWVLEQLFNEALRQHEKLSRIYVGPQNKLILADYDNIEIELRPIEMAFYVLFLKHPEGINFKDLFDHKDELWRYYKHATVTDDQERMKTTMERLIDPFSGSADQHRSRIARAINEAVDGRLTPELARFYKLEGAKGEDKKIMIPQDKIVWKVDW